MLSWPPAMTISESPSRMACAPSITAFSPEPHTALMVSAGTLCGRPLLMTVWRAGFCPEPAVNTWPKISSLICSPLSLARRSRSTTTAAPRSGAGVLARVPPNLPTAVRAAATMTMSVVMGFSFGVKQVCRKRVSGATAPWPSRSALARVRSAGVGGCRATWARQPLHPRAVPTSRSTAATSCQARRSRRRARRPRRP